MSYLQGLLRQEVHLEPHEKVDLLAWLKELESECEIFGAAAEDERRMSAIRAKLDEK